MRITTNLLKYYAIVSEVLWFEYLDTFIGNALATLTINIVAIPQLRHSRWTDRQRAIFSGWVRQLVNKVVCKQVTIVKATMEFTAHVGYLTRITRWHNLL